MGNLKKRENKKDSRKFQLKKPILLAAISLAVAASASVIAGGTLIWRNSKKELILHNPEVNMDAMCAGQKVTWDCIYFGSYPQTEVKDTDSEYTDLHNQENWDNNGDTVINGTKYRRILKSDATRSEEGHRYYKWEDDTTYHYFRYEPVKWRVLKTDGNNAMLLSDIVLDNKVYNTQDEGTTWETSTIRSWLNGYGADSNEAGVDFSISNFINSTFSNEELAAIADTQVVNSDNMEYGTEGGNNTIDKLFLLSESEVYTDSVTDFGFVPDKEILDEARMCGNSDYAKAMGLWSDYPEENCCWWIRSQGYDSNVAAIVLYDGRIDDIGNRVNNNKHSGVRVALNLNLTSSNLYTYAGTVCSDGIIKEKGESDVSISNPTIENVMGLQNLIDFLDGQNVKWDCVYFGSYPQTEVKETDSEYDTLQNEKGWDSNGDVIINGTKYRRMLKSDAVYADVYRYYSWEDDTTYHYFRYEPVKWRVLKTDGKKAFLLSDVILDAAICNEKSENGSTTWEQSKVRSWLNGYDADSNQEGIDYSNINFINNAFTDKEQSIIADTEVVNNDNFRYETEGGNNTKDKLFLLSESEVYTKEAKVYGFSSNGSIADISRRCKGSDYAKAMGVAFGLESKGTEENCQWWLRSPGENSNCTAFVYVEGIVSVDGYFGTGDCNGVRVALNLNLTSDDLYTYAGVVCSEENVDTE
ncbi:MAG: hypothetical protein K2I03_07900 [Lachnospiraceae bacterium]|nr:hypothetical protein [Lachnospiraceae bacterium]MDE6233163.1 hypothetical protein [Lachnospiraceae bacterium]MDE6251543.1 hypothetical protein [Lachnospiraceae bacterium]